jgi:uroporphyrinogen-III synthase
MPSDARTPALSGCYVISLRPVGGHAALRRAATAQGARLLALSPWRLAYRDDAATRDALHAALSATRVVFTSPAAVRAAEALQPLQLRDGQVYYAVGGGTARTLRRAGIAQVEAPARMDSEGLLALPGLRKSRRSAWSPHPAAAAASPRSWSDAARGCCVPMSTRAMCCSRRHAPWPGCVRWKRPCCWR